MGNGLRDYFKGWDERRIAEHNARVARGKGLPFDAGSLAPAAEPQRSLAPEPVAAPTREAVVLDNATIEFVWGLYLEHGSVHRVGEVLGCHGDSVWKALKAAGKRLNKSAWTAEEENRLREFYSTEVVPVIAKLCQALGRSHASVTVKAGRLGCSYRRGKSPKVPGATRNISDAHREMLAERFRKWWENNPVHPRGMLGKHHSSETCAVISELAKARPVDPEWTEKSMRVRLEKYGTLAPNRPHGSWAAGWREIGGKKIYARSRWEANYARFLEWQKGCGEIAEWEHEPETFWFEEIKRGCRSYLPDFRVRFPDGRVEYHEVKGWMDERSKTKIKRMAIYHPGVVLVVKDATWWKANRVNLRGLVPGWENGSLC